MGRDDARTVAAYRWDGARARFPRFMVRAVARRRSSIQTEAMPDCSSSRTRKWACDRQRTVSSRVDAEGSLPGSRRRLPASFAPTGTEPKRMAEEILSAAASARRTATAPPQRAGTAVRPAPDRLSRGPKDRNRVARDDVAWNNGRTTALSSELRAGQVTRGRPRARRRNGARPAARGSPQL